MPQSRFVNVSNGWPVINPGSLRHQVTIQGLGQLSPQQFDAGGEVLGFSTFLQASAAIEAIRSTDAIQEGQTTAQLYMLIVMRYRAGILPSMRIQARNGVYNIQAVENVMEMNLVLELTCIALGSNQ